MASSRERRTAGSPPAAAPVTVDDTADPAVSVRGLTKRYGDVLAVDGLAFELRRGTITGFLGPNGAGKSTTMRLLVGLSAPTAGEALIGGRRYADLDHPARHVGAVLESGDFDPGRSARNHLRALALAGDITFGRVEDLLERVGLRAAADRTVKGYSLGMRQRLGLAAALLGDPQVLLLDEPANGLDPQGVHWLRGFLREFASAGGTVLVSSHVLAEVAQTVDAVLIMNRGRLVASLGRGELAQGSAALEQQYLQATAALT